MPIWPMARLGGRGGVAWLVAASVLLVGPGARGEPAGAKQVVELRYRYERDRQLTYLVKVHQRVRLSSDLLPDAGRATTIDSQAEMARRVLSVRGGRARLRLALGSFRARQAQEGLVHKLPGVPELEGIRLEVVRDERGRVLKAGTLDAAGLDRWAGQVALSFSRAQQLLTLEFPSRAVAAGDSWRVERRVEIPLWGGRHLPLVMRGDYTLKRLLTCRRQRCAAIASRVEVSLDGESDLGEIRLRSELRGNGQGEFLFGLETGTLIKSTCQTDIGGRLSAVAGDESTASEVKIRLVADTELVR